MEIRILKLTIQQTLSPPYLPYLICINATRFNRHIPRLAIDAGAIEGIFPYPTGVSVIESAGMMPLCQVKHMTVLNTTGIHSQHINLTNYLPRTAFSQCWYLPHNKSQQSNTTRVLVMNVVNNLTQFDVMSHWQRWLTAACDL